MMEYGEAWIDLYNRGAKLSAETGALFRVEQRPVLRFEAVLYERNAGFIVAPAEWAVAGGDHEAQRALLREKMDLLRKDLFAEIDAR